MKHGVTLSAATAAAILATLLVGGTARAEEKAVRADSKLLSPEARSFKLAGPEAYKVNRRSKDLLVEDLNGDGLLDISTTNNERGMLEIYHQVRKPEPGAARFERSEIALDRLVRSAVATDVDGDGRVDLVLASSPANMAVMYQDGNGRLQSPTGTALPADRLVLGDVDGKGGPDLLVLSDRTVNVLLSGKRGINLEPAEVYYTTSTPASDPMLIDFDGDGRNDIVYHDANRFEQLVVRLQSSEGHFPAEFRVGSNVLRSVAPLVPVRGGNASVLAVQNSNRALIQMQLGADAGRKATDGDLELSELQTIAFAPEARSRRFSVAKGDADGDRRTDLLMVSPELSQLRLLRQTRGGSLRESMFPTLLGIESAIAIPSGKGQPDGWLLLSSEEKAIGYTTWDATTEALPFPSLLPITGNPVGTASWRDGEKTRLAVLLRTDAGHELKGFDLTDDGKIGGAKDLAPADKLPNSKSKALGMESLDVNRDGRADLVIYVDFNPALVLVANADGTFAPLSATSGVLEGLLSGLRPGLVKSVTLGGEKDGRSLLAIKDKFARAIWIDKEQNVVVEDQFNGRDSSSRIVDAAVGSLRSKDSREVVLLDRTAKVLTIHGREKSEPFTKLVDQPLDDAVYTSISLLDLDSDGRDDIILGADDRLSVIYARSQNLNLNTIASATTPVEDGAYGKVWTPSLPTSKSNGVVAIEMSENLLEFFEAGKDEDGGPALNRFYSFKVFDSEATIARRVNIDGQPEPRELVVADLDEDGLPDVVTLIHDNIMIYPGANPSK
ncbi:hypothetical protein GC173_17305 [bacterium]|nr:hypothetical protein [bacterium]